MPTSCFRLLDFLIVHRYHCGTDEPQDRKGFHFCFEDVAASIVVSPANWR